MMRGIRVFSNDIKKELRKSLSNIFAFNKYKYLDERDIIKYWNEKGEIGYQKPYLFWDEAYKCIVAVIYSYENKEQLLGGVLLDVIQRREQLDIDFGNCFCRVFNEDIRTISNTQTHSDLWFALRPTQFQRAIAKFSTFITTPMVKWMQIVESSTALRYEGNPFTYCLFMINEEKWIEKALSDRFVKFAEPIKLEKGLLSEKWVRSAVDVNRVGLVGLGHEGDLIGIFNIPSETEGRESLSFAPHESMRAIRHFLVPCSALFITTANGEIYIMLPNGAIFHKTQGRWHYLNYIHVYNILSTLFDEEFAYSLLRLSLDLSFERHGALIVIPDKNQFIEKMVPDHVNKEKVNKDLRNSVKGLNVNILMHRQIIMAAAKSDGALVLSKEGIVLDVACMITEPSQKDMSLFGINNLKRFCGARSTAAWNSSIYGTSIEISEDGPITIYNKGKLLVKIG